MKKDKKLFEQAILDAKSIRDSALANAKATLEESLTPKLQKMLAKKLQEQEEKLDENSDLEEGENLDEELDLDEILAELELEEGGDQAPTLQESHEYPDLDEADDSSEKKDSKPAEPKKDSKPSTPKASSEPKTPDFGGMGGEEGVSDEDKLNSLTVADLKDILRDIVSQEMSSGDAGLGDTGLDDMGGDPSLDSDPSLGGDQGMDDMGSDLGSPHAGHPGLGGMEDDDEDINLEALLQELEGLDEKKIQRDAKPLHSLSETEKLQAENAKLKADLDEAKKAVGVYRKELNEQNLLNAKLLYVNRIFKAKNLTESQKVKVITTFDKVTSVKDAKLVYEALNGAVNTKGTTRKPITESRGFASKPAGIAPKQPIVEDNTSRWQYLAGIKKTKY
jgi:hypothetical protein